MSGMFCFCLHSSLLKLQRLEVEGGPSLRQSPEESHPALGSKEQKSPSGPMELGGVPADENSPPGQLPVLSRPPLSPRPTPLSHRFNSDPDSAPSPPCSQQYILCRGPDRAEGSEDQACPPSIQSLTRHIQALKKKVRRFEDQFEHEMNYQPSHNDKYSNPEMVRVMGDLAKARKQLKEMRLRQSVFESDEPDGPENSCRSPMDQHPSLEETVESLFRRLREKKQALGLPDDTKEMTQAQLVLEKITLQKCLLYFESLHGRAGVKQKNVVKPLYDRYQLIKRLLCASPTITTIEEEDGSDEDSLPATAPPPPRTASSERGVERDSQPRDGEQRDGEQRDSQQRDSQQRDGEQRDSQQRDSQQRDSQQRDGEQRDSQQRDSQQRDSQQRDSQQRTASSGTASSGTGEQRDGQQRDSQQQDGEQRDSQQRDSQQRDSQQRDSQQRDGQQQDGQQRDSQQRDSQQQDGEQRDSQQRDSQQRDSQQRDSQQQDGEQRDSQQQDGEQRDSQQRDSQQRDSQQRDSEPALVSPLAEVKNVCPPAALTTANLHEASRSDLLRCLRQTRAEKKLRRKALREFEDEFHRQTGRVFQKEDRSPMKEEYQDYKQLKAKLRLLEVLLSKQEVPRPM
ncbi:hypothetical protein PFLUV_G00016440 [Perca fluviatilis]|uniref:FAM13A-like domain-containing protein n=1 Tax=Perca fluviatilis TaxID=8168 RepID=A0A6A5FJK0_PERFL|nr:hypothetical protein PFLUV_G00016440 [Perca fluviatilis]